MQYSLYTLLIGLLIAVILFMLIATRKNLNQPGAKDVTAVLVLVLFALVCFELSLIILSDTRFIIHEMKFMTLVYLAPCSLFVYLSFTGNSNALSLAKKLLLCALPFVTAILALTNGFHNFFRKELYAVTYNNVSYIAVNSAWWYWIYTVYSYLLYAAGIYILVSSYFKKPKIYRDQIGLMITTSVAVIIVNLSALLGFFDDYGDIGLIMCSVVCMAQYLTLIKFSHKLIVTKARNLVIEKIDSLVLIYDHNDRLVDTNKDSDEIISTLSLHRQFGKKELYLPDSGEYFSISDKAIYDEKGLYTGRVVVLNDITSLKTTVNELEYITTHDYLTGLRNRRSFRSELLKLKDVDLPAALICISISGINLLNNIFGYEHGDKAAQILADKVSCLTERAGKNNVCARLNDNEMTILLRNSDESEALNLISELLQNRNEGDSITLEVGYAIITDKDCGVEQLFTEIARSTRKRHNTSARPVSEVFLKSLEESLGQLRANSKQRYEKISRLCFGIGRRLSLSATEIERLRRLSVMADIGLLSAPEAIVRNIGNLTNEQWEEMKLHTVKGHTIALSISELSDIAAEILSHHERYDGRGYPRGLSGSDIPLLSRIFAAAEFYADIPEEIAVKQLRARSGTQFDPDIADAIIELVAARENV